MTKSTLLILAMIISCAATAQVRSELSIPQLLSKLQTTRSDTAQLNIKLLIADAYIMKRGEEKTDLDTAILLINQVQKANDNDQHRSGMCHFFLSKALREKKLVDSARKNSLLALDLLGGKENIIDWAFACIEVAHTYDIDNIHEDSLRIGWYYKAIPIFESTGRTLDLAACLENLGDCVGHLVPSDGIPILQRSLAVYRSLGPDHDLRSIYTILATEYDRAGDPLQAITYGLNAIREDEKHNKVDGSTVAAYNHLGITYHTQGNLPEAIAAVRRARDLSFQLDTPDMHMLTYSLVKFLLEDHQLEPAIKAVRETVNTHPPRSAYEQLFEEYNFCEYYLQSNRLDSARPHTEKMILLMTEFDADGGILKVPYSALLDYGMASHQFDVVKKYGLLLLNWGLRHGDRASTAAALRQLSRADSALGDYRNAMGEYQSYVKISDSLRLARDARTMASLKLQYETEKKDKDIQSLTHQQQLSNLALHQAGTTRNFIIAGACLLFILLAVSYNRYRLKQRSNKQLNYLLTEKDHLLIEKEWLLKEIHHRVKNNLQIGISLLNLQSSHIESEKAQSAIRQSRNRMYAMSLLHQRLYQADNLKTIDMPQYIKQLIQLISDSYETGNQIDFQVAIQPLDLDVEHALPTGLIINEAVTNSIKYAFPNQQNGRITVSLQGDSTLTLIIADNGVGVSPGFDLHHNQSMGMQLIDTLVQQLEGSLDWSSQSGFALRISFRQFTNSSANRRNIVAEPVGS